MGKKSKKPQLVIESTTGRRWSHVYLAAAVESYWAQDWKKAVVAFEKDPEDFYAAFNFLYYHPANTQRVATTRGPGTPYSRFWENLYVMVVKVDPLTKRIETKKNKNWKKNKKGKHPFDASRNTETAVWVEWGPYVEGAALQPYLTEGEDATQHPGMSSHDWRVDTGGASFEEAIVNLAWNVYHLYGGSPDTPDDAKLPKKLRR